MAQPTDSSSQQFHSEFATNSLGTAAFIIAKKALLLLRIEVNHSGRALFIFKDPLSLGPGLEADFLANDGECPALRFHTQLRVLRKQIDTQHFAKTRQAHSFSNETYKEKHYATQNSGRR